MLCKKLGLNLNLYLLLKDFLELMTKQMNGIRRKTRRYAVCVMFWGRFMSRILGVAGR